MTPNLDVVVGINEQFFLGGYTIDDIVNRYKNEQSLAMHTHPANIRSVSNCKHYLASTKVDDTICLYDTKNIKESGKLMYHNETVNSISFTPDGSHIITVSNDGTIGIIRCSNWQLEKQWLKPYKELIVDTLVVHPTGKMAMTTGNEVIKTWNVVKDKQLYASNLVPGVRLDAKNISAMKWSPNGNNYFIVTNNRLDIYSVEAVGIQEELTYNSKITCAEYLSNEFIAVGLDNGKISIYDLENDKKMDIQAHHAKVKCLACNENILVSASCLGDIKIWSLEHDRLTLLNEINCTKITCTTKTSQCNLKRENDKVKAENIFENLSDEIRLKLQVIDHKGTEKKKNKRVHNIFDNDIVDVNLDTAKTKKLKTEENEKVVLKTHKRNASDEPVESIKKKKKFAKLPKIRKEEDFESENVEPVKKKKKKYNFKQNNKKRKITEESVTESLLKKQKVETTNTGTTLLEMNFNNEILR